MNQANQLTHIRSYLKKEWVRWLLFAIVAISIYFIHLAWQTHLGKKALAETGLPTTTLEAAFVKAHAENKLIFVDISAIWCPTCRRLDREIFSQAAFKSALSEKYIFTRLEYEAEGTTEFMQQYSVSGFPTLLILDSKGNKIKQLRLTFNLKDFIAQM